MSHPFHACTPESVGVPSAAVERYIRAVAANDPAMHGLMMIRRGRCFFEAWWKPFDASFPHRLYSCSKSFVSVAVGLAIDQGYLRLDDKVLQFFPDLAPADPHPYLAAMTVRDLLRMASCWTRGSNYSPASPNWEETFFTDEVSHVPGAVFNYCTSGTTMLCAILKRVTGKQFLELLRPVFDAIGVGEALCVEAPAADGVVQWGGSGVIMTMPDFARFAQLVMRYGAHEGRQLLPGDYLREATSFQIANPLASSDWDSKQGYGYQFWMVPHDGFAFYGMGGQYALCFPKEDLLVVTTGYEELNKTDRLEIFRALWREIFPCLSDAPLPEDPAALARARAIADGLELPHARGALSSATQAAIDGRVFRMDDGNRLGLKWLRFTFGKDECLWEFENATGAHQLSLGIGKNIRQEFPERYCALRIDQKAERGYDCFASAAWAAPDTLLISVHIADKYLGQLRMTARFGEDTVTLLGEKHAEWFLDEFTGFASGRACQ